MREIIIKRPYRHFKGKLYYVHDILTHFETGDKYVSYQALYEPYTMYTKPIELFAAKVEKGRKDNITDQEYKFELYKGM